MQENYVVMLLVSEDVEPPDETGLNEEEDQDREEEVIVGDVSSLNTLSSNGAPRSLCLLGKHGIQVFQVLIENGSTHNFTKPKLVEKLKLSIVPTSGFRVYIGNDNSLVCQHKCLAVFVNLQGTIFNLDVFVLPTEGADMILGVQWLQELGRVTHDYRSSCMEFKWKCRKVSLK